MKTIMRQKILNDTTDQSKDQYFEIYLEDAKHIFLDKVYPYEHDIEQIPTRYQNWQVRAAIELYNRLGEEGIMSYSENGLSYSYKTDSISEELLSELPPPRAKTIGGV